MCTIYEIGSKENQVSIITVRNKASLRFNAYQLSMQSLNVTQNAVTMVVQFQTGP